MRLGVVGVAKKRGKKGEFCHVYIAYVPAALLGYVKRGGVGEGSEKGHKIRPLLAGLRVPAQRAPPF